MTTIVYDHKNKQIAVDSRVSRDGVICTDEGVKFLHDDSGVWFFCGKNCDKALLVEYFEGKDLELLPEAWAIYAKNNGEVYLRSVNDGRVPEESLTEFSEAIGSGEPFALAALDHGKSAKEAVEYAMTRDTGTGGKVHVFDVGAMEFLDD